MFKILIKFQILNLIKYIYSFIKKLEILILNPHISQKFNKCFAIDIVFNIKNFKNLKNTVLNLKLNFIRSI